MQYKRNGQLAWASDVQTPHGKPEPIQRPCGPFESCGDCPYPTHGFLCYGKEGDCLRTDMNKIHQRKQVQPHA